MGIIYQRLGREHEAIRCFDKAYALVDLKGVNPDRPRKRESDPKAIAVEYFMRKIGNASHDIFGTCKRVSANQWAIPIALNWKALRGPGREYDTGIALDCGELLIDNQGRVVDDRAAGLYGVALLSHTGAFEVRKRSNVFTCIHPHQYGRLMIARLLKASGLDKKQIKERGNQIRREIKIGNRRVVVEDYEKFFAFRMNRGEFFAILGLNEEMRRTFMSLDKPSVVIAFNRPIAVCPCEDSDNPDEILLDPEINRRFRSEFKRLAAAMIHQKAYPLEEACEFDYEKSAPLPAVKPLTAADLARDRFEHPEFDSDTGRLEFKAARPEIQGFIESQYRALLESIWPTKVKGVFNGRPFEGRVMEAATSHYACYFLHDAFRNTMAMSYFDSELARELMLTMLRYGTDHNGAFPNGKCAARSDDCQYMLPVWALYDRCRDREWLAAIYEVIEQHAAYWEKYRFIKEVGLYSGSFGSPDYDWGAPGEDINVFSAGLNSSLYLFKMLKARMAKELGRSDARDLAQAENIRRKINARMWDEQRGFYFNYDAAKGAIFQTASPDCFLKSRYFYRLHNLIPLCCGVPDPERAKRMTGVLTDPAIYGRFRGIIETVSGAGCDERRLRVWPFFNWLVLQGLRMYGLHQEADRISTDLYNMCFKAWYVHDDFPECFDATHGYLPEENPNVGGVGTISVPLLLVLDRIGIYHSSRLESPGLQTRPVKESGIGDISFHCCIKGKRSQIAFREGHGLTIHKM
ncbi:MAG: hypothetical protein HY360_09400 [Verrucomicrobia bacterium]|nr:hypothetical protein [Verrucomicrobiota bacterium]